MTEFNGGPTSVEQASINKRAHDPESFARLDALKAQQRDRPCTCTLRADLPDGTPERPFWEVGDPLFVTRYIVVGELCDYCTEMLWAAELEQRLNALPTMDAVRDHVGERNYMDAEQFEQEFEKLLDNADVLTKEDFDEEDFVTKRDLERDYEFITQDTLDEAIEGISLDDYVKEDDLQGLPSSMTFSQKLRFLFGRT